MRSSLAQSLKIFFNAETIAPFLIGSVVLAILGNTIYDILKNTFGSNTSDLIRIGSTALLILCVSIGLMAWSITQRLKRTPITVPFEVRQKELTQKYKGLILLVSQLEACETAIRFHIPTLKRCWLICSPKTLPIAEELCRRFPKVCLDPPIVVNDIYNPLEFRARVNGIYRNRLPKGWQESEAIADYTGMTVHASVGTVLACVGSDRPLQYTPATFDAQGKAIGSLNPIRVWLR